MYEHIVVGTDLSPTAKIATDHAAALAARLGSKLYLVHAGSDPGEPLRQLGDEYGAQVVVEPGNPADVLIEQTQKLGAGLLVVGSVGMSGARRFLLGSVPNKVSHHAGTDLLVVKTDPPSTGSGEYARLLVGTDGSPTSIRAVKTVAELAGQLGAHVTVVSAYEPPSEQELAAMRSDPDDPVAQWSAGSATRDVPAEFRWRLADAAQARDVLDRAAEHASERGVEVDTRAVEGNPAEVLLTMAEKEGFDLVAVGSVGMSGAKRFMLGNVPHRISHHATTDVLILKTA